MKRRMISRLCSIMFAGIMVFTMPGVSIYANETVTCKVVSDDELENNSVAEDDYLFQYGEATYGAAVEDGLADNSGTIDQDIEVIQSESDESSDEIMLEEDYLLSDKTNNEDSEKQLTDSVLVGTSNTDETAASDGIYADGYNSEYFIVEGNKLTGLTAAGYALEELVIPEGIDEIGRAACGKSAGYGYQSTNAKTIKLPATLKYIRAYAFSNCKNLTRIEIPEKVESIEEGAFNGCSSLEEVNIKAVLLTRNLDKSGKRGWKDFYTGNDVNNTIFKGCKINLYYSPNSSMAA